MEIVEDVEIVKGGNNGKCVCIAYHGDGERSNKKADYSHDVEPFGWEILVFDIAPSKVIRVYTSEHGGINHAFRTERIVLYKRELPTYQK